MSYRYLQLIVLALLSCYSLHVGAQNSPAPEQNDGVRRVLFIGNSLTYFNDLPSLVAAFSTLAAQPLQTQGHTMPYATLGKTWAMRVTPYLVKDGKWDFVVLQEGGGLPINGPDEMHRSVRTINAAIKDAGAKTVLYMTWPRQDQPNMQGAIVAAYSTVGTEIGALVAPVGPAWGIALQLDPKIPLYNADGLHPSPTGSYLAACAIFLVISSAQSCPPLDFPGVTRENAELSRTAAVKAIAAQQAPK